MPVWPAPSAPLFRALYRLARIDTACATRSRRGVHQPISTTAKSGSPATGDCPDGISVLVSKRSYVLWEHKRSLEHAGCYRTAGHSLALACESHEGGAQCAREHGCGKLLASYRQVTGEFRNDVGRIGSSYQVTGDSGHPLWGVPEFFFGSSTGTKNTPSLTL
jgi:hypothetical protein